MKIVVNDIAASSGGAMTVLKDFYQYVRENDAENEWVFLLSGPYLQETERIKVALFPEIKQSRSKKLLFDFLKGKKYIVALKPDVVFSLQNIITFGLKVRQVVYIHQPIPFQKVAHFSFFHKEERSLAIYQHLIGFIIKASARQADRVIVQTQWMKKAVSQQAKVPEEHISAILPDVGDLSAYRQQNGFVPTHFFYPTSGTVYKNNNLIYQACELLNAEGYCDFNVKLTLPCSEERKNITYTGILPREDVLREYNQSTLVFPSYIETFGYPMAEARQIGTLILASDCPFSHEILDGYENAYFFDPFQPQELADLMAQIIDGNIKKATTKVAFEENRVWKLVVGAVRGDI